MASKPHLAGLLTAVALALLVAGCSKKESPTEAQDPPPATVYTVNYPLAYFAERLAPENIEVRFPAPREVDPAFWRPSPEVIGEYQKAGSILLNGAGYARWTQYATLPNARTVATAEGCRDAFLPSGETLEHQHGPEGEHAHGGTAFTTWLDLRLAICQAGRVRDALIELSPGEATAITARFAELERDLADLDTRLRAAARAWGDQPALASHPVYQYLADAYALRIESLHFEPDETPGPDELRALDAILETHRAQLMLWEAAPTADATRQLRERGITVVVFDPAAQPPDEGDFLTVMHANTKRLACAMGSETCP